MIELFAGFCLIISVPMVICIIVHAIDINDPSSHYYR